MRENIIDHTNTVRISGSLTNHDPLRPHAPTSRSDGTGTGFWATLTEQKHLAADGGTRPLFISETSPKNNEEITAVGFAMGRADLQQTKGTVTGRIQGHFQVSAMINPGNSGGPVIRANGHVLGIIVSGMRSAQGMSFIVPCTLIRSLLHEIPESLTTGRILLTAYHVVQSCTTITIEGVENGPARLAWASPDADIAVLRLCSQPAPRPALVSRLSLNEILLERTDPRLLQFHRSGKRIQGARCRLLLSKGVVADGAVALRRGDIVKFMAIGVDVYNIDQNAMVMIPGVWPNPLHYSALFERVRPGDEVGVGWYSPVTARHHSGTFLAKSRLEQLISWEYPEFYDPPGYRYSALGGCVVSPISLDLLSVLGAGHALVARAEHLMMKNDTRLCVLEILSDSPFFTEPDNGPRGTVARVTPGDIVRSVNGTRVRDLREYIAAFNNAVETKGYVLVEMDNGYVLGAPVHETQK